MNFMSIQCVELDEDGKLHVPKDVQDAIRTRVLRAGDEPHAGLFPE
jgi:hypothetical protein